MEYKDLPFRKRKLDESILEELGILPPAKQQKVQSGGASIQTDVKSLVVNAAREQDRYLTIERRVGEFKGNLHPESAQRSRMSSGDNNCYFPTMAPVKASQVGPHEADGACEGMTKVLKASYPFMPSDKAAPVASESLWEGSMQFYFNTKVPMLAFFKSGQKLLDINWSSLVEIKGKLPLEDFETYIRDLPRSRTRKLMVISLCWKLSASTAALEFLQSVMTRYETTKQVAYAQPSPDVRLYMYPWKEVITTTLVKCGYLEEKAAIADSSELLIGCVVWRENQITSGSLLNLSDGIGTYSLKEQSCKSPTGKNQTPSDTLLKRSDNKDVEPLKEQGYKSSIIKHQNNSDFLLKPSNNRGARLLKEREDRLFEMLENKGVEPSKEQGFKSAIGNGRENSGFLLEQSKNREAGPLKKREIRGARLSKEQEVWSPVRAAQTSSFAALKYSTVGSTDPQKKQGLKIRNDCLLNGQSNLPSNGSKWKQPKTEPTSASALQRTITSMSFCKVEETAVGKRIFDRYDNKNPSFGNDNGLPGLLSSKNEPSAVGKMKPYLPSHSNSLKTASRNVPKDCPGHLMPSEFPTRVESSNNPRRFSGSPLRNQIFPPIPNKNNSLSRYFTFSQKRSRP